MGGAGYLGGALTSILLRRGCTVKVYDNLLYEDAYRNPVEFCLGDVRDEKRLLANLEWADAVVWLAAIVGDAACALRPDLAVSVNDKAVKTLANSFDRRIVFTSTSSVYGAQEELVDENGPVEPLSLYAATKLGAEKYLEDRDAIIFRLATLFGLSDTYCRLRLDLVVHQFAIKAFKDKKIEVFGGNQYRPFLHVRDAALAIADNIQNSHTGIFNLNWTNLRMVDLAEEVRRHFPDAEVIRTPQVSQDRRTYRVSSERAQRILGFSPKLSVDEGINELKCILEEGRIKDLSDPRYRNSEYLATERVAS